MTIASIPFLLYHVDFQDINNLRSECIAILFRVIVNILLLQAWIPLEEFKTLNGVSWYLSVCTFLYFCFPYIFRRVKKIRKCSESFLYIFIISILQIGLGCLIECYFEDNLFVKGITYYHPVFRLFDFTIGCNLGWIFQHRKKIGKNAGNLREIFTILINIIIIGITLQYGIEEFIWWQKTVIYILSSCLLVYSFACNEGIITKSLTNSFFINIGNISAYTFLIHEKVIASIRFFMYKILKLDISKWFLCLISLTVTIFGGMVWRKLYIVIQKNFMKKENKFDLM